MPRPRRPHIDNDQGDFDQTREGLSAADSGPSAAGFQLSAMCQWSGKRRCLV